jgi:hypothetical protein
MCYHTVLCKPKPEFTSASYIAILVDPGCPVFDLGSAAPCCLRLFAACATCSGHQSFSNNRSLNDLVGNITHSSIMVPYHGESRLVHKEPFLGSLSCHNPQQPTG